ncbi:MAG: tRNA (adenosine(37)-N6)-threonylcarbamoyltransferase complex transferase subunit TsaD [candidate division WOR-3 bacterium]|nr:tRNA (adenosine(37)-N6)-threonylcarbamoyltransferase complex transferase subunit TsaD [candidate division WOR-3 bacterium]
MIFLGIETSCDETAVGIVSKENSEEKILSNIVSSQWVHKRYAGVLPELASRAHIQLIVPVFKTALEVAKIGYSEIDGIAVTYAPGLVGALLVGLSFAKAVSISINKPFVGVNHLEGHVFAIFLSHPEIELPFICLIISGGHTELVLVKDRCSYEVLGSTIDDACGEAFDKVARMLGYSYPGGAFIEKLSESGKHSIKFPLPNVAKLDFSFSGLKTAVLYFLKENPTYPKEDVACSFQNVVVDFLLKKINQAVEQLGIRQVGVAGGVAINRYLQRRFFEYGTLYNIKFYFPRPELCMDNGAMIALAGLERYRRFGPSPLSLSPIARVRL